MLLGYVLLQHMMKKHPFTLSPSGKTAEETQPQSRVWNPEFLPHDEFLSFFPSQLQDCYHCFFWDLCTTGVWPGLKWWSGPLHAVKGIFTSPCNKQ